MCWSIHEAPVQPQIHNIAILYIYIYINNKGDLTGCGLHGDSLIIKGI